MLTAQDLLALADAYGEATGLAPSTVGRRASGTDNAKVFRRLRRGKGCHSSTLETATAWFRANWPDNAPWPDGVPR